MTRTLAVIVGLLLGLGLAAAVGGRVGHLRALRLAPAWKANMSPDAGLPEGRGTLAGAALSWRWHGLDGWTVTLRGADWQAQAQAWPGNGGLVLSDLRGVLPLSVLEAGTGALAVEGGALTLDWGGRTVAGDIDGRTQDGPLHLRWIGDRWTPVTP